MLGIHNRCKDMGSTHCTTQTVSLQTLATCFLRAMEWVWPFLGGCGVLFRLLFLVCWLWLPPLSQCHVHIGSQHNVHQDHCHHSTHHRAVLVPQNTCARDKHVTITSYAAVGLPSSRCELSPSCAAHNSAPRYLLRRCFWSERSL